MSEILTGIHGNRFGLDNEDFITTPVGAKLPALKIGPSGEEVDVTDQLDNSADALAAAVGEAPVVSGLACTVEKTGKLVTLSFTFTALSIPVTDAGVSGSSGSVKIFDFVQQALLPLGSRQNYTAFAEGALLTGNAGDAAFVLAAGSVAANAGDGALTGTEVDFAPATNTITLSSGTATATKMGGATAAPIDGTTTATDLYLNFSGSAATIDASSTLSVTGTLQVALLLLGDD